MDYWKPVAAAASRHIAARSGLSSFWQISANRVRTATSQGRSAMASFKPANLRQVLLRLLEKTLLLGNFLWTTRHPVGRC